MFRSSFSVVTATLISVLHPQVHAETMGNTSSAAPVSGQACTLIERTKEVRGNMAWDRQQANIDLMLGEMRGYNPKAVKIAVIDGAFTASAAKNIRGTVEMDQEVANPSTNHATEVISRITQAAPGSVIKNYPVMEDKYAGIENLMKIATQACAEGYKVINLSVSNPGGSLLSISPMVRAGLAAHGCVLVQASGNDSATQQGRQAIANNKTPQKEDDFFTVEANDARGVPANFSNNGTLSAAGVNVPVFDPTSKSRTNSGTSFSSPTVTAITKNVATIVSSSPKFSKLAGIDQTRLIASIVKASVVYNRAMVHGKEREFGQVDGYRAVVLAKATVKQGFKTMISDSTELREMFAQKTFADAATAIEPPGRCTLLADCEAKRTCYQTKRKLIALKGSGSLEDYTDLADLTGGSADPALAQQWTSLRTKTLATVPGVSR